MTENENQKLPSRPAAFFTDFDGTIKPEGEDWVAPVDLEALREMKNAGWTRVVATGRSLFGFAKAWRPGLELDWLIFSSGAGLCSWNPMGPGPLLTGRVFTPEEALAAVRAALALGYGFFVYDAPPDNHHFYYHMPQGPPAGFLKRMDIFRAQSRPWPADGLKRLEKRVELRDGGGSTAMRTDRNSSTPVDYRTTSICAADHLSGNTPTVVGQMLIMVPGAEAGEAEAEFRRLAPGLSVVRASSPFGDGCLWLEIFPPEVSKGRAAAALVRRLGLDPAICAAAGNDYNDLDLLNWAGHPFITADAPADLLPSADSDSGRASHRRIISPAGHGGLAQAWRELHYGPASKQHDDIPKKS